MNAAATPHALTIVSLCPYRLLNPNSKRGLNTYWRHISYDRGFALTDHLLGSLPVVGDADAGGGFLARILSSKIQEIGCAELRHVFQSSRNTLDYQSCGSLQAVSTGALSRRPSSTIV